MLLSVLLHRSNQLTSGKIIVIEGIDNAGKTTQSRLLVNFLKSNGKICTCLDFPDYSTPIGSEIRAFLDGKRQYPDQAKFMLLSANRWERSTDIHSMLESGTIVIMNRYYQSNLVYGVSKKMDLDWLQNLDKGLPREDLCIILDISQDISISRSKNKVDLFEGDYSLLDKVNKNYKKLARDFNWKVVKANTSKEEVGQKIVEIVKANIKI
jgi:dTMP kinase